MAIILNTAAFVISGIIAAYFALDMIRVSR